MMHTVEDYKEIEELFTIKAPCYYGDDRGIQYCMIKKYECYLFDSFVNNSKRKRNSNATNNPCICGVNEDEYCKENLNKNINSDVKLYKGKPVRNQEERLQYIKDYRIKHRERYNESKRLWYHADPERKIRLQKNMRERMREKAKMRNCEKI